MKHLFASVIFLSIVSFQICAQSTTDEARNLIEMGYLADARTVLGNSSSPEDLLLRGRLEFYDYNFNEAAKLYAQYKRAIKKAEPSSEYELFNHELELAQNALERVEKLVVIDSFEVEADSFLKDIRLPISAGRLLPSSEIPFKSDSADASMAFTNERGDFMMWSKIDDNGFSYIVESSKLTDGKWEDPLTTPDFFNRGGNTDYPFMMADGSTLYFASDGEDSMGGFDIFVATKDPATGEYRQPQNIGMPYNSPFDDYMLCVDELNGIGWWVSDRKLIPGKVTIYVYLLNDLRNNLDPELDNLTDFASLADISLTQEDVTDLQKLQKMVRDIKPGVPEKQADFYFPIASGISYTTLDDFRSSAARKNMQTYISDSKMLQQCEVDLKKLRKEYHGSSTSVRKSLETKILKLETEVSDRKHQLDILRGKIVSDEKSKR